MENDEIIFREKIPQNPTCLCFSDQERRLLAEYTSICFGKQETGKRKFESGPDASICFYKQETGKRTFESEPNASMNLLAVVDDHVSSTGTSKKVVDDAVYFTCLFGQDEFHLNFYKTSLEKYKKDEKKELRLTRSSYTALKKDVGTFELVMEASVAQLSMLECRCHFDVLPKSADGSQLQVRTSSKTSKPLLMLPSPTEAARPSPLPVMSLGMIWIGYEVITPLRKILYTFILLLIGDKIKVETLTAGWLGINFVKDNDPTSVGLKAFIQEVQQNYNTKARGDGKDGLLEMGHFLNCEGYFLTFVRSAADVKSLESIDTCFCGTFNASPSILCLMLSDIKIFLEEFADVEKDTIPKKA